MPSNICFVPRTFYGVAAPGGKELSGTLEMLVRTVKVKGVPFHVAGILAQVCSTLHAE